VDLDAPVELGRPLPNGLLEVYPLSTKINSSRVDGSEATKVKATGPGRSGSAEVDERAAISRRVRREDRHERAGANDGERSAKQLARPGTTHQLSGERQSIRRERVKGPGSGPGILRSRPYWQDRAPGPPGGSKRGL
jgi:hypothetical protein